MGWVTGGSDMSVSVRLEQVGELVLGVVGYGVGADVYFGSSL